MTIVGSCCQPFIVNAAQVRLPQSRKRTPVQYIDPRRVVEADGDPGSVGAERDTIRVKSNQNLLDGPNDTAQPCRVEPDIGVKRRGDQSPVAGEVRVPAA